jgi:signal transduction histidine kinase
MQQQRLTFDSVHRSELTVGQYSNLLDLAQLAVSHPTTDAFFPTLALRLQHSLNFDFVTLGLYDSSKESIRLDAWKAGHAQKRCESIPVYTCTSGWAWKHQRSLLIQDLDAEPKLSVFLESIRQLGVRTYYVFPLTTSRHKLGAIGYGSLHVIPKTNATLEFLRRVAAMMARFLDTQPSSDGLIAARVTRALVMGELVATIAHEVNQPLTAIVTNANFSLRGLASATPDPAELRAAITAIVNDGIRASAVISRIRGLLMKETPKRMELDINKIIQDVTTLLHNELTRNRVSLRTELAADLSRVVGDPVQLQQVLINLLMNAVDAMRASTGSTRDLLVRSARNPAGALVQVQDSGPGIAPELAGRMFEPFFTTKAEGIGMGLSISRSIIESHGGHLSLVPASQGALFQFTLPVAPNEAS